MTFLKIISNKRCCKRLFLVTRPGFPAFVRICCLVIIIGGVLGLGDGLGNGTPHIEEIYDAFNRHEIACDSPSPVNRPSASVCGEATAGWRTPDVSDR